MKNKQIDCLKTVRKIREKESDRSLEEIVAEIKNEMDKNEIWRKFREKPAFQEFTSVRE